MINNYKRFGHIAWISIACIVWMIAIYLEPRLGIYGMHGGFLQEREYLSVGIQFLVYSFLHGGFLHALSNIFFLVFIGIGVQYALGKKLFFIFFLFIQIFVGVMMLLLVSVPTIGMSGFALAVLSLYTMILWSRGNPQYKSGIVLIAINIFIGLSPGISLQGHLWGAIGGVIFWLLIRKNIQRSPYQIG